MLETGVKLLNFSSFRFAFVIKRTKYSRLPIIRTFKGNIKKFELLGVRVVEGKII